MHSNVTQLSLGWCWLGSQVRSCKWLDFVFSLLSVCVWCLAFPSSLSSAMSRINWSSLQCIGVTWFPLLFLFHLYQRRHTRVAPRMGTDHSAFDQAARPVSSRNSKWLAAPPGHMPANLPRAESAPFRPCIVWKIQHGSFTVLLRHTVRLNSVNHIGVQL